MEVGTHFFVKFATLNTLVRPKKTFLFNQALFSEVGTRFFAKFAIPLKSLPKLIPLSPTSPSATTTTTTILEKIVVVVVVAEAAKMESGVYFHFSSSCSSSYN